MRSYPVLAVWTLLAGAGIPLIGILNSGLGRSVGNPFTATAVMFAIAMTLAFALSLPFYGPPTLAQLGAAPKLSYAGGLLIGFYALSATIIIPRFGAASFIAFILIAQLVTSAIMDQFGLFEMAKRPLGATRLLGLLVIVAGIVLMEAGNVRTSHE